MSIEFVSDCHTQAEAHFEISVGNVKQQSVTIFFSAKSYLKIAADLLPRLARQQAKRTEQERKRFEESAC